MRSSRAIRSSCPTMALLDVTFQEVLPNCCTNPSRGVAVRLPDEWSTWVMVMVMVRGESKQTNTGYFFLGEYRGWFLLLAFWEFWELLWNKHEKMSTGVRGPDPCYIGSNPSIGGSQLIFSFVSSNGQLVGSVEIRWFHRLESVMNL